jgi:hypothetical protein
MNSLNAISWSAMLYKHPCNISNASDLLWGNFEYQLAKKDMMAITLLQHLAIDTTESPGAGHGLGHLSLDAAATSKITVGLIGSSKGGGAAWIAAAADRRIQVVAPEHNQAENITNYLDTIESSWGCNSACQTGSGSGTGQNGTQMMIFREWMRSTPAGRTALSLLSPHAFYPHAPSTPVFIIGSGGSYCPYYCACSSFSCHCSSCSPLLKRISMQFVHFLGDSLNCLLLSTLRYRAVYYARRSSFPIGCREQFLRQPPHVAHLPSLRKMSRMLAVCKQQLENRAHSPDVDRWAEAVRGAAFRGVPPSCAAGKR